MTKRIPIFVLSALIGGFHALKSDSVMPPPQSAIDAAEEASEVLIGSLLAGIVNLVGATDASNVDEASQALSVTFDDWNQNIRLVGELAPLSENNRPMDEFEMSALTDALNGQPATSVERVRGRWFYRSAVPLANFVAQCALCHTNYGAPSDTDYTGALMVRVPIE